MKPATLETGYTLQVPLFIDEGDVDMIRILSILKRNNFDGVIIPDHTPQMSCPAPWHAGMAHTLGYVLGVSAMLESRTKIIHGDDRWP